MTEHVQLEIIAAIVVIGGQALTIWRAEMAARRASEANIAAMAANVAAVKASDIAAHVSNVATASRTEQVQAIEQVHQAVNGGMAAQKREIISLKEQLLIARAAEKESKSPEQRHEEIRGQE